MARTATATIKRATCPECSSRFPFKPTRRKTYCGVACQSKAANARTNARRRSIAEDGSRRRSIAEDGSRRRSVAEDGSRRRSVAENGFRRTKSLTEAPERLKTHSAAIGHPHREDPSSATPVVHLGAIEVEWLDVFPDLHRCVAGRMNKTRTTPREFALAMDRTPVGHVLEVGGSWVGKVRNNGVVVCTSEAFGTLDEAKRAVERQLALSPEIVSRAVSVTTSMSE